MVRVGAYRRSKKLYDMGNQTFVKARWWPMSIPTEDGVTLEREAPMIWHGETVGYQYIASFDDETMDPSHPNSEVYDSTPELTEEERATGFVPQRFWPKQIDLTDGTILVKTYTPARKGEKRHAYYYVETWGDLDPSLPESEVYEGEFEGKTD